MPELPEVETVVRAVRPHLVGRAVTAVTTTVERLRTPLRLAGDRRLLGRAIVDVRRRAKYVIAELDGGHALLLHLGMTGSFRIQPAAAGLSVHDRVSFALDDGNTWVFCDPRRFGQAEVHALPRPGGEPACLADLGPEPLGPDFDVDWLQHACRGRRRPIKNLIMDQDVVVGVGNIYASEALFRAHIRPMTAAGRLSRARLRRLHTAIREVLHEAIAAGGTTIINFKTVDGSEGLFRRALRVYQRTGERCRRCGRGRIRRLVQSGRSSYYCPVCQR